MDNSGIQRLIPIALVLIVIIIAIAALVSLGRGIFGGGEQQPVVDTGEQALLNTSLDRSVRMTVRGPIVGDDQFHTYTTTISPTTRTMTTYEGYLSRQVETRQLANNSKGYEQFVYALDRAQLLNTVTLEGEEADMRGICATGRVFQFDIMQASNVIKKIWTTTCQKSRGTLKANRQPIINLFNAQITNFTELTNKIDM